MCADLHWDLEKHYDQIYLEEGERWGCSLGLTEHQYQKVMIG